MPGRGGSGRNVRRRRLGPQFPGGIGRQQAPALRQLAVLDDGRIGDDQPPVVHVPLDRVGLSRVPELRQPVGPRNLHFVDMQGQLLAGIPATVLVPGNEVGDSVAVGIAGDDLTCSARTQRSAMVPLRMAV